ncbi:MAG: hypothetical protein LQ338_007638 [Usnochroma carphineum]|nr:MAG: hypothetical protein LQ338_007638 [Usnochroma carphineum]
MLEPPSLAWSDIVADDPLEDLDGLWDNVDFARDGSDEDADSIVRVTVPSEASFAISNKTERITNGLQVLLLPPDNDGLNHLIKAQFSNQTVQGASESSGSKGLSEKAGIDLTEAQIIREVSFILHGLPGTIFEQQSDGSLVFSPRYRLKHISQMQTSALVRGWGALGARLGRLRKWKSQEQQYPLLQTFQAAIAERLAAVEHALPQVQSQCLRSQDGSTASVLCFNQMVRNATRLIEQLASVLGELDHADQPPRRFRILELIYNQVCINHSIGDTDAFKYVFDVFSACLQTYLKPLKHWMEHGELSRLD